MDVSEKTVSARLLDELVPLLALKAGVPVAKLLEGLPVSPEMLFSSEKYVSWNMFQEIQDRAHKLMGDEALIDIGRRSPRTSSFNRPFRQIIARFFDARSIYKIGVRWYIPRFFKNVQATYEDLDDGRVRITMQIDRHFRAFAPSYLLLWKSSFESAPSLIAQPYARVNLEPGEHRAVFTLSLPPSHSLIKRLKRAWRVLVSINGTIDELGTQEQQLKAHYEDVLRLQQQFIAQQTRLELASNLAHASRMSALGQMANALAHEINTPLTVLRLQCDNLEAMLKKDGVVPEAFRTHLDRDRRAIAKIAAIVAGMRQYSEDTKDQPLTELSVQSVVTSTLNLCTEKFARAGITLETDLPLKEIKVNGRPGELSQVLLNLLNNAYDAVEKAATKRIKVIARKLADQVEIAVEDSGAGITPEFRDKLFQPFFTTKPVGHGTGLGLSVSEGLIRAHGGRIELDASSQVTRLRVLLPLIASRNEEAEPEQPRQSLQA